MKKTIALISVLLLMSLASSSTRMQERTLKESVTNLKSQADSLNSQIKRYNEKQN